MFEKRRTRLHGLALGVITAVAAFNSLASAQTVAIDPAYNVSTLAPNVAGGFSHLPDGDILALTSDFANGPTLLRIDRNGDGIPAGGVKVLAQFDSSTFPDFVRVAPSGAFAIVGLSGSSDALLRVDLKTEALSTLLNAPGNYDLAFLDDGHAYLSANPGFFDPSQPSEIDLLDLTTSPPTSRVAVAIRGVPSGPVALNNAGDLYFVKSTYTFPPPPLSSRLLKFTSSDLAKAVDAGTPLSELNSPIDIGIEGGFNLAFHGVGLTGGELYFTNFGPAIFRMKEQTLTAEKFLTVTNPQDAAFTYLSFYQPTGVFDLSAPSASVLAASLATDSFTKNSLLEVRPLRFFAKGTVPAAAQAVTGGGTLTVVMERVADGPVRYKVKIKGPNGKSRSKSKTSSSSVVTFTRLKPGSYQVQYTIEKKVKRRYQASSKSQVGLGFVS